MTCPLQKGKLLKAFRIFFAACGLILMISATTFAQSPDSLWSRMFGGSGNEKCYSIQQTSDGGYILAGYTDSYGAGYHDFWLVKTDANGDTLWTRTFGGTSDDECRSVVQTSDGGYILAGSSRSFNPFYDGWLVRVDANGDSLWAKVIGGSNDDYAYSVQQTYDGGYVVGGETKSFGAGDFDFYLVRLEAEPTGVRELAGQLNGDLRIESNPVGKMATVTYSIPTSANVLLNLYDVSGRLVRTIYSGVQESGIHRVSVPCEDLSSGVYFICLEAGQIKATEKLILLSR